MARKSAARPAYPNATMSNQDLIEECIITLNMVGEDSNQEILEALLRQEWNLDCIVDDDERAAVASKFGWKQSGMLDRVAYCRDQAGNSTAKSIGGKKWLSFIDGDQLVDREGYHKLRLQRLKEQIRQKKKKVEQDQEKAALRAHELAKGGGIEPVSWEEAEDEPLERIHTWSPNLDEWFGTTTDYAHVAGGEVKETNISGIAEGFSYAVGAPKGMGKTRFMVRLIKSLCGPTQMREDGIIYGGGDALYIQAEESLGRMRSQFLRNVWKVGKVRCLFSQASRLDEIEHLLRQHRPRFVIIDSKDMIYEFNGPEARVKDGILRFNHIIDDIGATAFIICHVNKKGDLKGSTMLGHMVRAVILGETDENSPGTFTMQFDKNRGGKTNVDIRWRHGKHTVEIDDDRVVHSPTQPPMTLVGGPYEDVTGSVMDAVKGAMEIQAVPGRQKPRDDDDED